MTLTNKWKLAIGLLIIILLLIVVTSMTAGTTTSDTSQMKAADTAVPTNDTTISDFLGDVVQFAHEGYLADQASDTMDSSDITSVMTTMIETIDHEKSAVDFLTKYTSSSNSNIKLIASLYVASESDVIAKQQASLDMLRQASNGTIPPDIKYSIAQTKASMTKRTDNFLLTLPLFSAMTMDSSLASSSAAIGPLNPTSALSIDEKSSLLANLNYSFGDALKSHENDVFLLLAQNLSILLSSDTYAQYHDNWISSVNKIQT